MLLFGFRSKLETLACPWSSLRFGSRIEVVNFESPESIQNSFILWKKNKKLKQYYFLKK